MFCASADAHLRGITDKVKACSHNGNPSAYRLFVASTAGDIVRGGMRLQLAAQRGQTAAHRLDLEVTKEEYLSNLPHVFLRRDFSPWSDAQKSPPPLRPPPSAAPVKHI